MAAQRYRKKPVEIEAMQFDGTVASGLEIEAWASGTGRENDSVRFSPMLFIGHPRFIEVHTPEGIMQGYEGDWIIKGVAGEFYPCKPDIFAATYEKV